ISPDDYTASTGSVTFNANDTSKTVNVTVNGDLLQEGNEVFSLNLSSPSNTTLGTGSETATIIDNDTSYLFVNPVFVSEPDTGTVMAAFTIVRFGQTASSVTATFATANSSALAPDDYTAATGTVTFNGGDTSKMV